MYERVLLERELALVVTEPETEISESDSREKTLCKDAMLLGLLPGDV
jgi:hypothetical protein